jgi:hypothetical protein
VDTPAGRVPRVSSALRLPDRWGAFKVRWTIGRMNYRVEPGLYALGEPNEEAPVFVTANYKLSFDHLRSAVPETAAWILVVDTEGINVWCAAGKGTFGTAEVVARVQTSGLDAIVRHRRLILPQLAAPGVAAHEVQKQSGFRVIWGPIRAVDISAFLKNGMTATPEMRRKTFSLWERTILIPVELVGAIKRALGVCAVLFLLGGAAGRTGYWQGMIDHGGAAALSVAAGVIAGAVLTPLLLPWLPGRAFSLKGLAAGLAAAVPFVLLVGSGLPGWAGCLERLGWFLIIPAVATFLAMNFTGASTYTSLSGVRKEMRWSLPLEIIMFILGVGCWLTAVFLG